MSDKCQQSDCTRVEAQPRATSIAETLFNEVRDFAKNLTVPHKGSNDSASQVLAPMEIVDTASEGNEARRGRSHRSGERQSAADIVHSEKGEVIKRDVAPSTLKGSKATVADVAREHLGAGATDEEVKAHVKEIARINSIKDPDKALDGTKTLILPGHTKDGGFVLQDDAGNKRTTWRDGSVRIENRDGSGYAHKQSADGSYNELHWGKNPQDNYVLRKTPEGKYEVGDLGVFNFKPAADRDFRVESAKVKELADKKITDPSDRARFEADMNKFAGRQQELKERFERQGLTAPEAQKKAAHEMADTYKQIEKLLSASDNPKLKITEKERVALAEQVMHQAATPTDVSQGGYNTCNVAVIEVQAFSKQPSEAARLVASIAVDGKYTSNGKPPVTVEVGKEINADSLKKHGEAKNTFEPGENNRSHASQIFQVTAVNLHYAKENAKTNPPGQIRYEQREPGRNDSPTGDNGERLLDYSKKDARTGKAPAEVRIGDEPVRSPDLSPQEIANLARDIQGDNGGPVRIDIDPVAANVQAVFDAENKLLGLMLKIEDVGNGQPINFDDPNQVKRVREAVAKDDMAPDARAKINEKIDKLERDHAYVMRDGIAYVRDEKQLKLALQKLGAEGRLPIIVGVHTGTDPFSTDANEAGARGGRHVVNVMGYRDGAPPTVSIDNQWDKKADHDKLPVDKLFGSMQHRDAKYRIDELQKQVDANRRSGNIDYSKETELLFEKHGSGKITDEQLIDGVCKTFDEMDEARRQHKMTDEQFLGLLAHLRELRDKLSKEQQVVLIDRLKAIREENKRQYGDD